MIQAINRTNTIIITQITPITVELSIRINKDRKSIRTIINMIQVILIQQMEIIITFMMNT